MIVRNNRLKMSPSGIITLPVSARKALKMEKSQGGRVTVAVENNAVVLMSANKNGGFRISPKGQLELQREARATIETGVARHYWIELNDEAGIVRLNPTK